MPKCYRCKCVLGPNNIGLIQENGTVLCPRCDMHPQPPVNFMQTWVLCTCVPSVLATVLVCENAPRNTSEWAWVVVLVSNVISWGLLSGIGLLIYKQLRG
jgi:hypothetical protein